MTKRERLPHDPSDEIINKLAISYGYTEETIRTLLATEGVINHSTYQRLITSDKVFAVDHIDSLLSEIPSLLIPRLKEHGIDWGKSEKNIYAKIQKFMTETGE